MVVDHREGRLERVLGRYSDLTAGGIAQQLQRGVVRISDSLDIPTDVLRKNVGVSPYRQRDLLSYFVKRLKDLHPNEVIPAHPLGDFVTARENYRRAFRRIHTYLLQLPGKNGSHNYYAGLALRWMRGDPLPRLINDALAWDKKNNRTRKTATAIREVMEEVEDGLRFRYVRYFSAYNSLLKLALERVGREEFATAVPDIPLFLEMGGSSGAMINLMALGLSRTSADEISQYLTDKDMDVTGIRRWVARQDFRALELSPAVAREADVLQKTLATG